MKRSELIEFARAQKWAVEASVSNEGAAQAAVIGVAISDDFELVFDTLKETRKAQNLRKNPKIALVLGWDEGITLQIDGVADELLPGTSDFERLKKIYLAKFPDGVERESLPNITYFRVKPRWTRYSDFTKTPPLIIEGD
jgi:general stress protein 26